MPIQKRYNNKKKFVSKKRNTYLKNKNKNLNNYRKKKNNFANKRRPFTEIKSQSHKELWGRLGGTTSLPTSGDVIFNPQVLQNMSAPGSGPGSEVPLITYWFPIWSYLSMTRGLGDKAMLGKSITGKFLTAKIHFEFPVTPQQYNPRYYMIHGWVTTPLNHTDYTNVSVKDTTRSDILNHIQNMTKRDFDQVSKEEFLNFNDKQQRNYKILGYRKMVNKNRMVSAGIEPTVLYNGAANTHMLRGVPQDVEFVAKWPMNNRKLTYSLGKQITTSNNYEHRFPNRAWLPFLMFYCPDAGHITTGTTNCPTVAYDNKFWFSDS